MSDAKPLHVRVAEALGWARISMDGWHSRGNWAGLHPISGNRARVSRYDTDWSATGPLIERLGVALYRDDKGWIAQEVTRTTLPAGLSSFGDSPLVAVCHLILALHAAGKLPA